MHHLHLQLTMPCSFRRQLLNPIIVFIIFIHTIMILLKNHPIVALPHHLNLLLIPPPTTESIQLIIVLSLSLSRRANRLLLFNYYTTLIVDIEHKLRLSCLASRISQIWTKNIFPNR